MDISPSPTDVQKGKILRIFFISVLLLGFVLFRILFGPPIHPITIVTFLGLSVLCGIYGMWSYSLHWKSRAQ